MQFFVKGLNGATLSVSCAATDSLGFLKRVVAEDCQVDESQFSLSTGTKFLRGDAQDLSSFGLEDEQTLYVNADLMGGGKKRKKKQYTKPKKNKHKKKKERLAVLKYYKVDANNKVIRLRVECPSATCQAGVFMAKHSDRTHCGRCGDTYVVPSHKED